MTTGLVANYCAAFADIYGEDDHTSSNEGFFAQFDKKIKKTTLSFGARYELFRMDEDKDQSKPVFRAGMNHQLAKASFVRASFGQGYRYHLVPGLEDGLRSWYLGPLLTADEEGKRGAGGEG